MSLVMPIQSEDVARSTGVGALGTARRCSSFGRNESGMYVDVRADVWADMCIGVGANMVAEMCTDTCAEDVRTHV